MTNRERKIVEMLLLRNDVILGEGSGAAGHSYGHSHSFGYLFDGAFRELERLLDVMRGERPKQRRHVVARYVDVDRRPIDVPFTRKKVHGVPKFDFRLPPHTELAAEVASPSVLDDKTARILVYQWPGWVKAQQVGHGVTWLADHFKGVPAVPKELLEAA